MDIESSALAAVRAVPPYPPGKPIATAARELGLAPLAITKLASNENALGMPQPARQAVLDFVESAHRYPDSDCFELRQALARHTKLAADQLIIGAGSSQLILLAVRAFLDHSRAAVLPQHSFVSYEAAIRSVGARTIVVPARQWQHDLEGMRRAIEQDVRVVFIASPNNPTGSLVEARRLHAFIAGVPPHVLVVLDEAYRDYVADDERPDVHALLAKHPNLLVLRTFSKIYGLAGLRVGFGMGSAELINLLRRLQLPFSVNSLAQAAAIAALGDEQHVARCFIANRDERSLLATALSARRFRFLPSHGNFLLIDVGDGPAIYRALLQAGVIVRPVANYGLPSSIRVTIGLPAENRIFLDQLTRLLPTGSPSSGE